MHKVPAVYILASKRNGTLYIGVTSDLAKRAWKHRNDRGSRFTAKYQVHLLVHFEVYHDMLSAIAREKTLKKWRREWKLELIETDNPEWTDLWESILE